MASADCIDPDTAANFAAHALDDVARARVEAHIDGCSSCRELVSMLAKASMSIDGQTTSEAMNPWDEVLPRGAKVGPYEVQHPLSAGGMGVVYVAYDARLDRQVALKGVRAGRSDAPRLLEEAKVMAQLAHPNVVQVFDVVQAGGLDFIAMELVIGRSLRQWLQGGAKGWKEIVDLFLEAGAGLFAAHHAGIVHGDVKPANVLVGDDGRVRVTDFGLARWRTDGASGAGTPAYFAPEQRSGAPATTASDQWAFCASLHEALFDALPGKPPVTNRRIPSALQRVLRRGLSESASDRFSSMETVVKELLRVRQRDVRWVVAAVAVTLVVGTASFALGGRRTELARCEEAAAAVAPVWTTETQGQVHEAFTRTGLSYAEDTWARVNEGLSKWQRAFDTQKLSACSAATSAPVSERQLTCLTDAAREARALLVRLFDADAAMVLRAVSATQGIPSPQECTGVIDTASVAPTSQGIETVRQTIAAARATAFAGKYAEALALAKQADEAARALKEPHLMASARTLLGGHLFISGELDAAAARLSEAIALAEAAHEDRARAFAWTELVGVEYTRGRHQQVALLAPIALGAVERIHDERLATELQLTIGSSLSDQGKAKEAIAVLREAVDRRVAAFGAEDRRTASALSTLANAQAMSGDLDAAKEAHARALAAARVGFGPAHPETAIIQQNLGDDFLYGLHLEDAERELTSSIATLSQAKGPEAIEVVTGRTDLGFAHLLLGRVEEAQKDFEVACAAFEKAHPKHPNRAMALVGRSDVGERRGKAPDVASLELAKTFGGDLPPFDNGRVLWALGRAKKDVKLVMEAKAGLESVSLPLIDQVRKEAEAWLAEHGVAKGRPAASP